MSIETFISYARKDGLTHAEYLERALPDTWRDKRNLDPFKDFTAEIERAIDDCRQVVAVITPDTTREDSFVRRELAYAAYRKKPIIIVRFVDVPPPLNVFNHTWLDWFKLGWDTTLNHIREWMGAFVPSYSPPALADALAADPHREYVETLYDSIVDYLDRVIIKEVALKTTHTADAVAKSKPALLGGFYRRAGLNASEERIETLQEGLEHFKGRLLLLGEPGAGKTVSVLATARDAVVRRLNNPAAPLPILLRCAEWPSDPPMPLGDWVQDKTQLKLTSFNDAFVFFDGFDELGTSRIRKVKDKDGKPVKDEDGNEREESYDPRPPFLDIIPKAGRVLLSCRIREYEDFGTKVDLNGAVTLRPLTENQIHEYLADLPDLWDALSNDAELLEVMKTPLLLSLFAFGYKDAPDDARALRDLNAAQLSEAIFKQYIQKRYEHEALRFEDMGQTPPFTLDEVYDVLGQVAMRNASGGEGIRDNVLSFANFKEILKGKIRVQDFVTFASLINLITPIESAFRFIHLRLRDHFVRAYCYPRVGDERFYGRYTNPARALASLPNAEAVDVLAAQLNYNNVNICRELVGALGKIGGASVIGPLIATLKHTNGDMRGHAAEVLGTIGDARAVKPLIATLKDTDTFVHLNTVEALVRIGAHAIEPLIAVLKGTDDNVRGSAAIVLGEIGGGRAVEPLIAALNDADWGVRRSAAEALGKIGDARAVKHLIAALNDADWGVRRNAARALGQIGDVHAVKHLIDALKDTSRDVRRNAARALSQIGDARAVKPLIAALKDVDKYIRCNVAGALGEIGDARAVEPLIAALKDTSKRVRSSAAEALGQIGDVHAVEPLIAALKDVDEVVRRRAAWALGQIGDARAIEPLIAAFKDADKYVRDYAQHALHRIGTPEALAALEAWRKSQDGE